MTITLTRAQIEWLEAEVAAGRFASVDAAAQAIIAERMAENAEADGIDLDDLDWTKPFLEEALKGIARGETITLDEFNAEMTRLRAELRK